MEKDEKTQVGQDKIVIKADKGLKAIWKNPKKRLILIICVSLFIVLVAGGLGFYFLRHEKPQTTTGESTNKDTPTTETKPQLYEAILDGVMTTKELANRHPLGVIIENHSDARPQSGLEKASVVYEAIAEGGITRFLALYGENDAEKVGPIRSARTYFVDWAHGVSAYLAHVGGNMDALDKIASEKIFDLDQFKYSSPYHREYSAGLATEHTMYSDTTKLWDKAKELGYSDANNFTRYKFKDDPTPETASTLPERQKITVNFSSETYNVYFDYDKSTNTYKRFYANGKPVVDNISKNQLNPKNIIVMTVKRTPVTTRIGEPGYSMSTTGSGNAKIFLDGTTISGTWKQASNSDRVVFYDEKGEEVIFNRGQFWICVIPPETGSSVTVE